MKGLTLIELMVVLVLIVILMGIAVYVFVTVFISWSGQVTRAGIDVTLDRAVEEIVRDLRQARAINYAMSNNEIRFTDFDHDHYVYYFYNENDGYPPGFGEELYEIRKAPLAGNIYGTFVYGSGVAIIKDVVPPPSSKLSTDDTEMAIAIDLSVKRESETIRSGTEVRPRNL